MKFKILFFLFATALVISCSKYEETTDDLQSQIDQLESTIETLQGTISSLQTSLGSANSANNDLTAQLALAQTAIDDAQNLVSSNQSGLNSATSEIEALDTQVADLLTRLDFLQNALAGVSYNQAVNLEATGTLSEQSPEQARQTIYGRWNIAAASASKASSADRNGCSFEFIEFMEDSYLLVIALPDDEAGVLFGDYVLNEDADGEVVSVDLMFDVGDDTVRVAQLTNVVVADAGDDLNASFDVVLTLPEDIQTCESSLPGSVSAPKEEPVAEATTANAISNHAKLVGEWRLKDYVASNGMDLQSVLNQNCYDYNEETGEEILISGCEGADRAIVNFSDFGTYSISAIAQNGGVIDVEIGGWSWEDDQNTFVVYDESDEEGEEWDVLNLDESEFKISATFTEQEYGLGTAINPSYTGVFDGTSVDNGVYYYPTGAQPWAGFANENAEIYPLSFPNGGVITFNASAEAADVVIHFRFERAPYPDTEPSFETTSVNISGSELREYTVGIPAQDPENTFSSTILYLQTRDAAVTLSGFKIQEYTVSEEQVTETFTFEKY